jgi:hypothetical protein
MIADIEFRPVKGFEDYYLVSADGAVFSMIKNRFRKSVINESTGYATMVLSNPSNGFRQTKTLHRIVAEAWIPNPDNLECVNHINENKLDCHSTNLEWCSKHYNNTYNGKTQRCCKKVAQINISDGRTLKVWDSARQVHKSGIANYKNVSAVCRGKRKSAGGYKWRFI